MGKLFLRRFLKKNLFVTSALVKVLVVLKVDSGAPLLKSEIKELKKIHKKVKSYMSEKGLEVVEKKGVYVVDQKET